MAEIVSVPESAEQVAGADQRKMAVGRAHVHDVGSDATITRMGSKTFVPITTALTWARKDNDTEFRFSADERRCRLTFNALFAGDSHISD